MVVPVDAVINPNDTSVLWYDIPNFPGYQISNNGYIRSFKQYRKYPLGTLVKFCNKECTKIQLTNSNNQRVIVTIQMIHELVSKYQIQPDGTCSVKIQGRNSRMCINPDQDIDYGVVVSKPVPVNNEPVSMPTFNIPDVPLE